MTIQEITNYIDKKINENESFIRITFFEIRVKYGLTEKETDTFLELAKNKFENMGYNVYFTGAKFIYDNSNRTVQPNELMLAIKD